MRRTTQLAQMIRGRETRFVMEAHNGLSARLVEEAGFEAIWASGLTMSASCGVRDANELSWTQVLGICEMMCDATSIPVLVDADTGFGNFNNVRRLVRKAEQCGIAGLCIEDKRFPKTNSFLKGETQAMASIDEVCGKVRAAKDSQADDDFCIVMRTEAFITGRGLGEALRRADAYRKAGADAVLVHSKRADAEDIEAFMAEWADRHPVVIVPTTYASTPTARFEDLGVRMVIWANHTLRSTITSMRHTLRTIQRDRGVHAVQPGIATVRDIFDLQQVDELFDAEARYLPGLQASNAPV